MVTASWDQMSQNKPKVNQLQYVPNPTRWKLQSHDTHPSIIHSTDSPGCSDKVNWCCHTCTCRQGFFCLQLQTNETNVSITWKTIH